MDIHTKTSLKIVGKIDTRVYYYYHGELKSRSYFIPVQPGTGDQLAWWNIFKQGVTDWHLLSPAEQQVYNTRSKRYKMSGFNLFMREYLKSH